MEQVILVNEKDEQIGLMEKMEAHEKALLHRAFSVFLFNEKDELLLQQRAHSKYHSGSLWTNTCCSHQRAGETSIQAGKRRLQEEMGITADLSNAFQFIYKAQLDNNLTEHEFDHVLFGEFNGSPQPNPEEVSAWRYESLENISAEIKDKPDQFTEWFKICLNEVIKQKKESEINAGNE